MKSRLFPLLAAALLAPLVSTLCAADAVTLTRSESSVRVVVGGKLFTEYVFKGAQKPYLYPVLAVDGTEMTRNYPMKKDVAGEVRDHPHHRSMWFTHGDVNGFDFWAETNGAKQGKIVNDSVEHAVKDGAGVIRARNSWVGPNGIVQCTDETTIRVHGSGDTRTVDYTVTLKAPADKPVVFGDTKEGSMAIRLPLWMTPPHSYTDEVTDDKGAKKKQRVQHAGQGMIVNAEGVKNTPTWGKKSNWVDYYAPKNGKVYGIAMFDHPSNPRTPTWWHVRDYALFAANPFGKHDFENLKDQPKAGDLEIAAGKSVTFRWRIYFHMGDEKTAKIAEAYAAYVAGK